MNQTVIITGDNEDDGEDGKKCGGMRMLTKVAG